MLIRPRSGRQGRRGRLLEAEHVDAFGVHARHHVFDRAVLARRIHALQDEEQRLRARGIEDVLQVAKAFDVGFQLFAGLRFIFEPGGEPRIPVG
jgi:hypothetical protein